MSDCIPAPDLSASLTLDPPQDLLFSAPPLAEPAQASDNIGLPQDWIFDESFVSPLVPELLLDPLESLEQDASNFTPLLGSDDEMSILGLIGPTPPNSMDPSSESYHIQNTHTITRTNLYTPDYFYNDQHLGSNVSPLTHHQDTVPNHNMATTTTTTTKSPPNTHMFSLSTAPLSENLNNTSLRPHGSPSSTSSHSASSKKRAAPSAPADLLAEDEDAEVVIKRQRNTMAARKYRQKRLDRISDLERALGDMTSERDQLKLQLARREAEVEALREMLSRK